MFVYHEEKKAQVGKSTMPNREDFKLLCKQVRNFTVKDIRTMLACVREPETTVHSFFPQKGLTCGEFCAAYVLSRQKTKSKVEIR